MRRSWLVCALMPCVLVAGAVLVGPGEVSAASAASGAAATVHVGSQKLTRCQAKPVAYCGTLHVPLDWQHASTSPKIQVCYRWYPATAGGPGQGTVVPVEGGPGYPSILSVAGGYRPMYGKLLRRDNMLAVDLRGTGCSTVLNCPKEQNYTKPSGTRAFARVVGACADALNKRWRASGGAYVHASDLFTSAPAAADLAAVIRALALPRIDLYGDSYGSWFAQVFAARYPSVVRSVVLDSTYQVQALDPWYRSTIATMPGDFDTVCARTPACAAVGGSSWPRIEALAHRLAKTPATGTVPGPDGQRVRVSMGVAGLLNLVSDSAEDPGIYAALDAAARAYLGGGQAAPLLRLYASRLAIDEAYFGVPVHQYSVELYMAVSCLDYPQLFPMTASPSSRLADLRANEATLPASTFAPFTTAQWLAMDQNTENLTACLDWPRPTAFQPPVPQSPPFLPRHLPVLILGGSLDTWTPPAGVPEVQAEIGGHSRFVELANETHVVGEGDSYGCAAKIIQGFVTDPGALARLNVSCAAAVPTVRAVGTFAGSLGAVAPVTVNSGHPSAATRRLAAAAVLTAGDAWTRYESITGNHDTGLYGGGVTAQHGDQLTLAGDELVPGVKISGTLTVSGSGEHSTISVVLHASAAGLSPVRVTGSWPVYGGSARAAVAFGTGSGTATGSAPAPEGVPY
jgi:pimeloyl-ACP methyl ester carboxylesterase